MCQFIVLPMHEKAFIKTLKVLNVIKLLEHENFRRLLFLVAPECTVPSHTTTTTRIGQMCDTEET